MPSATSLKTKGFSEQEILHLKQVLRRPRAPVHYLWLPIVLLAQTFVMLRLWPLLSLTTHPSVMIATVLLSFGLSWIFLEIAPHLARGIHCAAFIGFTALWAFFLALLLVAAKQPEDVVVSRSALWAAAWLAPLALFRLWRAR